MDKMIKTLETILEGTSKGLIYINEQGLVGAYSKLAKKITGVVLLNNKNHPAGRIKKGDIVIIADNEIGNDDELSIEDLKIINLYNKEIKKGDAIIAIGVYDNKKIEASYKYASNYNPNGQFTLKTNYLGFEISASIDFARGRIQIAVNEQEYSMDYFDSIGHMVVIDGTSGEIKFFQERGYGFRGEEIGHLLRGKEYLAKPGSGEEVDIVPTVGIEMRKIIYGEKITRLIHQMLESNITQTLEGVFDIHKRSIFCTLTRVKNHSVEDGVYITIQDATALDSLKEERSNIIRQLELIQKKKKYIDIANPEAVEFKEFIGRDPAMAEVKQLAYKASKTKFNVIITGESGTGKSLLAKEIHCMQNKEAPFVEVNCNAIAPSLFESELFGYVPGAFTGAASGGKAGYFEEADGGTIFLDEIGEIPLEIQIKLLHVLQNKKIYRVGSSKPIDVNVRVITATNKNLDEEVALGHFRQDLFYRINVFPINIPPLRRRKGDLYILINSILEEGCRRYGIEHMQLSEEALIKMMNYNWPGNVRELENIIERAITICDSPMIYSEHIMIGENGRPAKTLKEKLEEEELRIIRETMTRCRQDRQRAIKELGISKTVFYEKIKKLDEKAGYKQK